MNELIKKFDQIKETCNLQNQPILLHHVIHCYSEVNQ
jgi:hypothetical protein